MILSPTVNGRSGFTLIETLVSIAIIGLLLSVTIPAVQSARESARMTECRSHLRELGNALTNYEEQNRRLPAFRNTTQGFRSPLTEILPMLDQPALYYSLVQDGVSVSYSGDPSALGRPVLAILRCPSDQAAGGANYRGNIGPDVILRFEGRLGPMSSYRGLLLSECTDGLSNTVVMSESLMSPAGPHAFHRADAWYAGLAQGAGGYNPVPANDDVISLCEAAMASPAPAYQYVGQDWPVYGMGHSAYNHAVLPNAKVINCRLDSVSLGAGTEHAWADGIMKASSQHFGGVNVLLLDGSVHFSSNQIDLNVWQAISTHAGGESGVQF